MPSNLAPLGALPSRFRRSRILIVGCGDVGVRAARALIPQCTVIALTSSADRQPVLRQLGIKPLVGNLDARSTLQRLSGLAHRVIHLAPPPSEGWGDPRTRALLRALRLRTPVQAIVYGSTSGVYGDCKGAWIDETHPPHAGTPRAHRRVQAESDVRFFGRSSGVNTHILRIPGIYANDREGGTPQERLRKSTPVLRPEDDVYTNHIHADDLARACVAALWRGRPQRITNVNDDTELKMGDYFDAAADIYGLPRPARVGRDAAKDLLPVMLLSFMGESRRMKNRRLKTELRVTLKYPTIAEGLRA